MHWVFMMILNDGKLVFCFPTWDERLYRFTTHFNGLVGADMYYIDVVLRNFGRHYGVHSVRNIKRQEFLEH